MKFRRLFNRRSTNSISVSGASKYGVLTFSYTNAKNFSKSVSDDGFFSLNLGDYMQTLAARRLLNELGISNTEIVDIDRDSILGYDGEPVVLLMSAVFFPWSFPLPETIIPVFLGFQASEPVIKTNLEYFKRYAPIGCRDQDTTDLFLSYGVEAFTTGCVTMTFEPRTQVPTSPKTLLVCGSGAGAFPAEAVAKMPEKILSTAEFVFQRKIVHSHPLSKSEMEDAERYAGFLLDYYRRHASLVVTPLHHATTPCISSGIPVVICREQENTRFSFLKTFMDVHTPENFSEIDWSNIQVPNISKIRSSFIERARMAIEKAATS